MPGSARIDAILASGGPRIVGKTRSLAEDGPGADGDVTPGAHARAEEGALDQCLLADVGSLPEDAVADARPRLHPHARGEHGVGPQLRARGHAAARAHVE